MDPSSRESPHGNCDQPMDPLSCGPKRALRAVPPDSKCRCECRSLSTWPLGRTCRPRSSGSASAPAPTTTSCEQPAPSPISTMPRLSPSPTSPRRSSTGAWIGSCFDGDGTAVKKWATVPVFVPVFVRFPFCPKTSFVQPCRFSAAVSWRPSAHVDFFLTHSLDRGNEGNAL